ncbi:YvcK family protein [SAR202 cluster bacterium AC-409-J13_OGT_754m]|nr:YvcK family protein [SAR202 cluster bacterium AC-409-J13_OGT_754m]
MLSESKIVVIGGGTGNHTTLTGLKKRNCELTAVVTMSDDGGSSGRLRDELGQLPPGDIRQCLVALAADDYISAQLRKLFNYRFTSGQGLNGHSFGNLFISALTDITGNPATAIAEASRMLHIKGSVLPVTLTPTILKAKLFDGTIIDGESQIGLRSTMYDSEIDYVYLEPTAYPYPPVIEALEAADAIVIGPGDIFTSILPNLLVENVANAINQSKAIKIYICNLMTKPGESDGFAASDFLKLVKSYLYTDKPLDYLLVNNVSLPQSIKKRYLRVGQQPVELDIENCNKLASHIKQAPLLRAEVYLRHNPDALANAIIELIDSHRSANR